MKKYSLLFLIMLSVVFANAQINKGNFMVGGSISFRTTNYSENDNRYTQVDITPNAGYFFMNNLAAGIRTSVTFAKSNDQNFRDLGIGPFARYYFLPAAKTMNILLEGNLLVGNQKYEGMDSEGRTEFGLATGPALFINKNIALEALLSWKRIKYETDNGHLDQLGVAFGFQIHLECKKRKSGK